MKYLLILLVSFNCYAIDVVPIKKGEPAPKEGFFVDAENMKKLRKINEEKKLLEKENVTLKDLSYVNEQRIDTYKKLSLESEKMFVREKTKGNFKGVGGFLIGVAATSLAAYAAIRISR